MARTAPESISGQLESLFEGSSVAGLSDRQLLDRFIAAHDSAGEAAFAAIVARHGPMVLNVCRQLLGDHHHAEDAFQAVFLVLARRAPSIRDPDLLGNWLYGVALRTARCAKLQLDRRRKKEEGDIMSRPGPGSSAVAEPIVQPADSRSSTASRPRPSIAKSTVCQSHSACRLCFATSKASHSTRPPADYGVPQARSAAGSPAPETSFDVASSAAVSFYRR